jgi:hypothetical protein
MNTNSNFKGGTNNGGRSDGNSKTVVLKTLKDDVSILAMERV